MLESSYATLRFRIWRRMIPCGLVWNPHTSPPKFFAASCLIYISRVCLVSCCLAIFLDSVWYRDARRALVARFASLEIVSLPDVVFRQSESEHETALLIASQPRTGKNTSNVRHVRVSKADWPRFAHFHKPTSDDSHFTTQDEATSSLSVPQLNELWSYLAGTQTLGEIATPHPVVLSGTFHLSMRIARKQGIGRNSCLMSQCRGNTRGSSARCED